MRAYLLMFTAVTIHLSHAATVVAQDGVEITAPGERRALVGSQPDFLVFELAEADGQAQQFNIDATNALDMIYRQEGDAPLPIPGSSIPNQGMFANNTGELFVRPDISSASGGDLVGVDLTLTDVQDDPAGWTNTATGNIRVVDNRVLTGSSTIDDLGRHMISHGIGAITIRGDSGSRDAFTDVTINDGGSAVISGGFRITATAAKVFDGESGDSVNFTITRVSPGSYAAGFTGIEATNDASNPAFTTEALSGASLDLSDVTLITNTGTAVRDRVVSSDIRSLGRYVVGGPGEFISGIETHQLSTVGSGDHFTRIGVAGGDTNNLDMSAEWADGQFNSDGSTIDVEVTRNFLITPSSNNLGVQNRTIPISLNAVENLPGENPQAAASVGYAYTFVDNNTASADDVGVIIIEGTSLKGKTLINGSGRREHGTGTHTAINIDKSFSLVDPDTNPAAGTLIENYATPSLAVTGEGLVGEVVAPDPTFDVDLLYVNPTDVRFSVSEEVDTTPNSDGHIELKVGDSIQYENREIVAGVAQATAGFHIDKFGSDAIELQSVVGSTISSSFNVQPGMTVELFAAFNPDDEDLTVLDFGRRYAAVFSIDYDETFMNINSQFDEVATVSGAGNVLGAGSGLGTRTFEVVNVINSISDLGLTELDLGTDLFNEALALEAENSSEAFEKLKLALLDSETLTQATTVEARIRVGSNPLEQNLTDAAGFDDLSSDAVTITGLDGIKHTLQLSYTGDGDFLAWYSPEEDAWINGVLGNSNITDLDLAAGTATIDGTADSSIEDYLGQMQFEGSYFEYLLANNLTEAELGAFGIDPDFGVVWAVIDHNSTFASAIPEPGTMALLALGGSLLLRRRRRARWSI